MGAPAIVISSLGAAKGRWSGAPLTPRATFNRAPLADRRRGRLHGNVEHTVAVYAFVAHLLAPGNLMG